MNAKVDAFVESLNTGTPPAAAAPLLRAVWHGLRGEWNDAHQIAQDGAARKAHGFTPCCIASRAISPMPAAGIAGLSGRWPNAIRATKEWRLPRFF